MEMELDKNGNAYFISLHYLVLPIRRLINQVSSGVFRYSVACRRQTKGYSHGLSLPPSHSLSERTVACCAGVGCVSIKGNPEIKSRCHY